MGIYYSVVVHHPNDEEVRCPSPHTQSAKPTQTHTHTVRKGKERERERERRERERGVRDGHRAPRDTQQRIIRIAKDTAHRISCRGERESIVDSTRQGGGIKRKEKLLG